MTSTGPRRLAASGLLKKPPMIITPERLHEQMKQQASQGSPNPRNKPIFLDCTWSMPNTGKGRRRGYETYVAGPRIPGARFWDLDAIANTINGPNNLPHMLPGPEQFVEQCRLRGIYPFSRVILYDQHGVFSSPRGAFTFLMNEFDNVSILNGGLPNWIHRGLPIEEGELSTREERSRCRDIESIENSRVRSWFAPQDRRKSGVKNYGYMWRNAEKGKESAIVLDARSKERFDGTAPEPREGLPSGHIPYSLSLPFKSLLKTHEFPEEMDRKGLNPRYTTLKSYDELKEVLSKSLQTQKAAGNEEAIQELLDAIDHHSARRSNTPPRSDAIGVDSGASKTPDGASAASSVSGDATESVASLDEAASSVSDGASDHSMHSPPSSTTSNPPDVSAAVSLGNRRIARRAPIPTITATCGSGMTAAIIWAAFRRFEMYIGIYDEGWMGWATKEPIRLQKQKGMTADEAAAAAFSRKVETEAQAADEAAAAAPLGEVETEAQAADEAAAAAPLGEVETEAQAADEAAAAAPLGEVETEAQAAVEAAAAAPSGEVETEAQAADEAAAAAPSGEVETEAQAAEAEARASS